jgi:hypothetical protein
VNARMIWITAAAIAASACDFATDPATRLAYDIEAGADLLGSEDGATFNIRHVTPSKSGECTGTYKVQLDKVGALVIWCKDAAGEMVSSHSTSYHARFVETPQTYLIDKEAGETLTLELGRRGTRAVIVDVR